MKEDPAFRVLKLVGDSVVTHDDRLLLRAQKSDIGLELGWKREVPVRYVNGKPVVLAWCRKTVIEGEEIWDRLSPEEYEALPPEETWQYGPEHERELDLGEGVGASFRANQLDMRLGNLFDDLGSRYRKALESMVDLTERGVVRYQPRSGEPSQRSRQEAIRHRMKQYLRPTEYEHNVLIEGELGRAIYADVRDAIQGKLDAGASMRNRPHLERNTVYLQGYVKSDERKKKVKVYDIGDREGEGAGSRFKIETTLYKAYFKAEGIDVAGLTTQPKIQARILDELESSVRSVLDLCSVETQNRLAMELRVQIPNRRTAAATLAGALLHGERTLSERVAKLERDVAEHDRRLAALERAKGSEPIQRGDQ